MKTVAMAAAGLSLLATPVPARENPDAFFDSRVKPHLAAYTSCARQHLVQSARKDPANSFDRIEESLRPACGANIDRARAALFEAGLSRSHANRVIRTAYDALQPELRSLYEKTAASERERRLPARGEALRQESKDANVAERQQVLEVEKEREKLLKEAASQHDECISAQMKEIVPFSNENAETLAQVIIGKCEQAEKRSISLGVAFYGASQPDMSKGVKDAIEERKKRIVSDIVTFRAHAAKELMNQKGAPEERKSGNGI
ncbi:hypothetical protein WOC76_02485 [Methylocystis sp. IM3]|jgi:phenylpropionate dioxygenase-like ring-hydroxylating dioxygenase large terminal subunit|uniref:hypothetical protein n=1 Tax=unclassified Methylocystis TaxID=2625913 RepID=UPI000FC0CC76|nr:MAG: hypothetical protein EKK29_00575 [Hyphomicrobiales bacterium]